MLRSFIVIAAAALVAGLVVFLTAVAPDAKAGTQSATQAAILAGAVLPQPQAKGHRLPVFVKGAACSPRGWPHYEQKCLFDLRRSADDIRKVRIIDLYPRQTSLARADG